MYHQNTLKIFSPQYLGMFAVGAVMRMCFDTVAALPGQQAAGFEPSAAPSKTRLTSLFNND